MKINVDKDIKDLIDEEIYLIMAKVFIEIEEKEKINQEKNDADIKFNTISIEEIMSQSNNTINSFNLFENSTSFSLKSSKLNLENDKTEKEPVVINNIEELLLNETQITEIIYTYDKRYSSCFNESNMLKLIDYSTHMAYISDDEIITHKYPFYACELLKCDAPYIYNKFFDNEKIMTYFFDFLNVQKNNTNCVLSGYFAKIFLSLLDKKNDEIINFIFNNNNSYIYQMIDLCEDSSFCECIKNLLILQDEKFNDKKLIIIERLNQKLFQKEEFTNKICFEIFSSLFEEGNTVYCNFFLKNFTKIFENFKFKTQNLELFNYYKHFVRIIKECFTREKELTTEVDENRKELNNYVIKNKTIFLDFEILLIDSLTNNIYFQNIFEDNIKNKSFRRLIVIYIDILEIIIFSISIKDEKNLNNYINKIHDIFKEDHLEKITQIIFKYPLFNMLQVSYIELLSTLSKVNSPLLKNENTINKFIDYLLNNYSDDHILISTIIKSLSIIYLSQQQDRIFISSNKKLKFCYDLVVKKIMNIYESKLLFNQTYGVYPNQDFITNQINKDNNNDINNDINNGIDNDINNGIDNDINNDINIDNNNDINKVTNKDNNNDINDVANKDNNTNEINNKDNNSNNENEFTPSPCIKDVIIKCITELDNAIKLSFSINKNINDNISEEIDLDDVLDEEENESPGIDLKDTKNFDTKNNKSFHILENYDEIDDEDAQKSDNDNIDDIIKQTSETVKSIKQKTNQEKNNSKGTVKTEIEIRTIKKNILPLVYNGNRKYNYTQNNKKETLNYNSLKSLPKNINVENQRQANSKIDEDQKDKSLNAQKKINEDVLPKIKKTFNEHEYVGYFHGDSHQRYDSNKLMNSSGRINNFRSNTNLFKNKNKKDNDNSLFNNLQKSAENNGFFKLKNKMEDIKITKIKNYVDK